MTTEDLPLAAAFPSSRWAGPGPRRCGRAATAALLVVLAAVASGHVVYTPTTLRDWVKSADVIAVAEIAQPLRVWQAPDGSELQEYVSVRIVEVLRGALPAPDLDLLPHSEGEARWRVGDRVLLFLEDTAPRAEFAGLAARFPFFTRQGSGSEWKLAGDDPAVELTRAWAALPTAPAPGEVRALLLRELSLGDTRLRDDAVLELVRFRRDPAAFPDAASAAPFARLVDAPSLAADERIALARVLDGVPGFDTAAHLLPLTAQALDERSRRALISAASLSRDPRLSSWLAALLKDPDPRVRRAAAAALGHPWHAAQVAALLELAANDDEGVARSAVLALGAIDDGAARAGLETVAARRRDSVAATARRLLQRSGTGVAPTGAMTAP